MKKFALAAMMCGLFALPIAFTGCNKPAETPPATPPAEETTPPAEETTPPAEETTPPAEEAAPPAE